MTPEWWTIISENVGETKPTPEKVASVTKLLLEANRSQLLPQINTLENLRSTCNKLVATIARCCVRCWLG